MMTEATLGVDAPNKSLSHTSIVILDWMWKKHGLALAPGSVKLMIYGYIFGVSNNGTGRTSLSMQQLADLFEVSKTTIKNNMRELISDGLIESDTFVQKLDLKGSPIKGYRVLQDPINRAIENMASDRTANELVPDSTEELDFPYLIPQENSLLTVVENSEFSTNRRSLGGKPAYPPSPQGGNPAYPRVSQLTPGEASLPPSEQGKQGFQQSEYIETRRITKSKESNKSVELDKDLREDVGLSDKEMATFTELCRMSPMPVDDAHYSLTLMRYRQARAAGIPAEVLREALSDYAEFCRHEKNRNDSYRPMYLAPWLEQSPSGQWHRSIEYVLNRRKKSEAPIVEKKEPTISLFKTKGDGAGWCYSTGSGLYELPIPADASLEEAQAALASLV